MVPRSRSVPISYLLSPNFVPRGPVVPAPVVHSSRPPGPGIATRVNFTQTQQQPASSGLAPATRCRTSPPEPLALRPVRPLRCASPYAQAFQRLRRSQVCSPLRLLHFRFQISAFQHFPLTAPSTSSPPPSSASSPPDTAAHPPHHHRRHQLPLKKQPLTPRRALTACSHATAQRTSPPEPLALGPGRPLRCASS